jgi:hypothetical protein
MKTTHIAVLLGAVTLLTAPLFGQTEAPKPEDTPRITLPRQPAKAQPQPEAKYETREFATADLKNIRLVMPQTLLFTVAGVEYRYDVEGGGAALIALLAELRRTEKITVAILPIYADHKSIWMSGLTLLVGNLK